jgi:hypothetical protein
MKQLPLKHKGFKYLWTEDAFLTQRQAKYALERLWELTAGTAEWENGNNIEFTAVTKMQVDCMLNLPDKAMPWVPLTNVTPYATKFHFDTDCLPALCLSSSKVDPYFAGIGPFPLDLVAATFILLTRWEEWARPNLDHMGCYREDASLCARQGFRDRPVLDEWAVVLRSWLETKNYCWKAKLSKHRVWMSHDIDHLLYYKNPWRLVRGFIRDAIRQKSLYIAVCNAKKGISAIVDPQKDPCMTAIVDLMNMDDALGERGTFFFMSAKASKFDEGYDLASEPGRSIVESIMRRGFEIGWHPSYFAAENDELFAAELASILRVTDQASVGVRHHFLRWQAGTSWKRMSDHGIPFDASVGYNGCLGFRASTAHFYPAYDLFGDAPLSLEVRPLIVMDGPLFSDSSTAIKAVKTLMRRCEIVNGCFSVLIHNYTMMLNPKTRDTILASFGNFIY